MGDHHRQLLADFTGAELFVFEAEASEHGTPQEVRAAREELDRRVRGLRSASTAPRR